jgi:hypothetical protein
VDELKAKLNGAVAPLLEEGEALEGVCVASHVGLFKGRMVALATTDRRLIVQGMTRKFEHDGPPVSITPENLHSASAEGAGGGWGDLGAAVMDRAAVTLKLRTTDGTKLKLTMMRGTGPLGGLGGGETQRAGVEAVARFFDQAERRARSKPA